MSDVRQLREMFPQLDPETIEAVAAAHFGHTGMAINALLEVSAAAASDNASHGAASPAKMAYRNMKARQIPSFYAESVSQQAYASATVQRDTPSSAGTHENVSKAIKDLRFDSLGLHKAIPVPNFLPPPPKTAASASGASASIASSSPTLSSSFSNTITLPPPLTQAPKPVQQSFEDDDLASWTLSGTVDKNYDWLDEFVDSDSSKGRRSPATSLDLPRENSFDSTSSASVTSEKFTGVTAPQGSARQFFQMQQQKSTSESPPPTAEKFSSKKKVASSFFTKTKSSEETLIDTTSKKDQLPIKAAITFIQSKISKDRNRFVNDQFNLDLTYITPRIIAMAMPSEGLQTAFRNSLDDVAGLLETEHGKNYMVYNLSEKEYDTSKLNDQVVDFGWPDHQAPPLKILFALCKSIDSWLRSDPENVVAIHCKGGKGRTGTVICSYFLFSGLCKTPEDAIDHFGSKRMASEKIGVTQPSQRRYIKYFKGIISRQIPLNNNTMKLYRIALHNFPGLDMKGKIRPFLRIYQGTQLIHATATKDDKDSIKSYCPTDGPIIFPLDLVVSEDVMIQCFHFAVTGVQKLFRIQIFVGCLEKNNLRFDKEELDDACRNKNFPEDAYVEILFAPFQVNRGAHFLESFIPDDLHLKSGTTCYFDSPELNAKYA